MVGWQWAVVGAGGGVAVGAGAMAIGRRENGRNQTEPWVLRNSLLVLVVGAVGAIAAFVLTYRATEGPDKDRFDVAIKAATATAAVAAGLLTWGRLELSRHEHRLGVDQDLTERYGRAVEQLGSDDQLVRVGGVFALERFALDAVRADPANDVDWRMALGMLAALARRDSARAKTNSDGPAEGEEDDYPHPLAVGPTSVLEAVQALGRFVRRSGRQLGADEAPNLTNVVAKGADLTGANLVRFNLTAADLTDANLTTADLTHANLTGANLRRANLLGADLAGATLAGANLRRAELFGADLFGANLAGANVVRANLADANLAGAKLFGVDLRGADLAGANVVRANLGDANLGDANPVRATLTGVRYNDETVWPEGFEPPPSA